MSAFVSKEPVAVSDDEGNTIWILPRMSFGAKQRVAMSATTDPGTALFRENIVRWEGPTFGGVPYAPNLVDDLDSDEPVVAKAIEEIVKRNTPRPDAVEKKS